LKRFYREAVCASDGVSFFVARTARHKINASGFTVSFFDSILYEELSLKPGR
jgi:hypothetical protein